jgi:hyperosmotically inducible protein
MRPSPLRQIAHSIVVAAVLALPAISTAQQTPADNTKVNERDRAKGAVTADQQKENTSDRTITQNIRKSLMKDKTLSTYAHNVKIVSINGEVTLKGPVRTEDEKRIVAEKAAVVAGEGKVINEITIAPAKAKTKQ